MPIFPTSEFPPSLPSLASSVSQKKTQAVDIKKIALDSFIERFASLFFSLSPEETGIQNELNGLYKDLKMADKNLSQFVKQVEETHNNQNLPLEQKLIFLNNAQAQLKAIQMEKSEIQNKIATLTRLIAPHRLHERISINLNSKMQALNQRVAKASAFLAGKITNNLENQINHFVEIALNPANGPWLSEKQIQDKFDDFEKTAQTLKSPSARLRLNQLVKNKRILFSQAEYIDAKKHENLVKLSSIAKIIFRLEDIVRWKILMNDGKVFNKIEAFINKFQDKNPLEANDYLELIKSLFEHREAIEKLSLTCFEDLSLACFKVIEKDAAQSRDVKSTGQAYLETEKAISDKLDKQISLIKQLPLSQAQKDRAIQNITSLKESFKNKEYRDLKITQNLEILKLKCPATSPIPETLYKDIRQLMVDPILNDRIESFLKDSSKIFTTKEFLEFIQIFSNRKNRDQGELPKAEINLINEVITELAIVIINIVDNETIRFVNPTEVWENKDLSFRSDDLFQFENALLSVRDHPALLKETKHINACLRSVKNKQTEVFAKEFESASPETIKAFRGVQELLGNKFYIPINIKLSLLALLNNNESNAVEFNEFIKLSMNTKKNTITEKGYTKNEQIISNYTNFGIIISSQVTDETSTKALLALQRMILMAAGYVPNTQMATDNIMMALINNDPKSIRELSLGSGPLNRHLTNLANVTNSHYMENLSNEEQNLAKGGYIETGYSGIFGKSVWTDENSSTGLKLKWSGGFAHPEIPNPLLQTLTIDLSALEFGAFTQNDKKDLLKCFISCCNHLTCKQFIQAFKEGNLNLLPLDLKEIMDKNPGLMNIFSKVQLSSNLPLYQVLANKIDTFNQEIEAALFKSFMYIGADNIFDFEDFTKASSSVQETFRAHYQKIFPIPTVDDQLKFLDWLNFKEQLPNLTQKEAAKEIDKHKKSLMATPYYRIVDDDILALQNIFKFKQL